ncbi:sensor histidine kinase [Metallumcola ferriviriculae]|uniref:histidine kinase n=1 Tax=Metallumcola ferriviriculae TaxID=3039180 RepID=A0AAU0USQ1_9FIRM|nr:sensor histidine kinase [Desulfitibacteraceae bacterium MK1]
MQFLQTFFEQQNLVVFFVYGQVYFLMGFAILIKNITLSEYTLSKDIRLFAWFSITHGLADWAAAFVPYQREFLGESQFLVFLTLGYLLLTVSYMFLMVFGLKVAVARKYDWPVHFVVPTVIFTLWVIASFSVQPLHPDYIEWIVATSSFARYFIGLPAGLVAAAAFWLQANKFDGLDISSHLTRAMRLGAIFLGLYGILTGLVVPEAKFFPASLINYNSFLKVTGVPVQILRMVAGIGIGLNIIRSLELFDVEQRRRVEEAEKREAILKERERISREIHDGTIQSLYGIGLRLEFAQSIIDKEDSEKNTIKEHLDYSVEKLAETITDIRAYIMNLRHLHFRETSLRKDLQELVQDFRLTSLTMPEFIYREEATPGLTPKQRTHLYYIVREALNNIRQHARAKIVVLEVNIKPNGIHVSIVDDGQGFNTREVKLGRRGMYNIAERVRELKGTLSIDSEIGRGTEIRVIVPTGGDDNG